MYYDPFDGAVYPLVLRDEAAGLRTTAERGFYNSHWHILGTAKGDFPVAERSLMDCMLFRKRGYKSDYRDADDYIVHNLSGLFSNVNHNDTHVHIHYGDITLAFHIESCDEVTRPVKLSNGEDTLSHNAMYVLGYEGWRTSPVTGTALPLPDRIQFLDSRTTWSRWANVFSSYFVKELTGR